MCFPSSTRTIAPCSSILGGNANAAIGGLVDVIVAATTIKFESCCY